MPNPNSEALELATAYLAQIFVPDELIRQMQTDAPTALRELARAIEADDIRLILPAIAGNGFLKTSYNRVVMDVRFSLEVCVVKRAKSE